MCNGYNVAYKMSVPNKKNKKKKDFLAKLRDKYRLFIYNDTTFEEVLQFRLSRLYVFSFVGFSLIFLIAAITLLIVFTPLKEFIPGYPDGQMQRMIVSNALQLDSLQKEIRLKDEYLENINTIISGGVPRNFNEISEPKESQEVVVFSRTREDSILREMVEREERFNVSAERTERKSVRLRNVHFFIPLKGIISNTFNPEVGHFGVDIVSAPDEVVKAAMDGVVIFAGWTLKSGWTLHLQHQNNLLTVYKHNNSLLKKQGDQVLAGEAIAIVGNSGELSTGPHLHFEIWHDGKPIDPEAYLIF